MKTAVVHDWLISFGGAEKVLNEILELYPSPVFTLLASLDQKRSGNIGKYAITHSFIQNLPRAETQYRNYLPFFPLAIERFNLSEYDLIISSSHAVAKGVKKKKEQLHICYCHTPMRYAWDLEEHYLNTMGFIKATAAKQILKYLRKWDLKTSDRVDTFIANSHFVAERIRRLYGREATVIYPPVSIDRFKPQQKKENFYLTVSRLVPYKRVDLIVEAFNQMPHKTLKIVGTGPEMENLQKKGNSNIEFLGFQSDEVVQTLLASAKGFIFAAEEDFGIAPLEAQASGTAVIAYGRGGSLETIISEKTGLFFQEQIVADLLTTIELFETMQWDASFIRAHSEQFDKEQFKKKFKQFIDQQWEYFCENNYSSRR